MTSGYRAGCALYEKTRRRSRAESNAACRTYSSVRGSRSEGDFDGLRSVQATHTYGHGVIAVCDLKEARLSGNEAALGADAIDGLSLTTPDAVRAARVHDVAHRISRTVTVADDALDCAAQSVAVRGQYARVEADAGVHCALRSDGSTRNEYVRGIRGSSRDREAQVRGVVRRQRDRRVATGGETRRITRAIDTAADGA